MRDQGRATLYRGQLSSVGGGSSLLQHLAERGIRVNLSAESPFFSNHHLFLMSSGMMISIARVVIEVRYPVTNVLRVRFVSLDDELMLAAEALDRLSLTTAMNSLMTGQLVGHLPVEDLLAISQGRLVWSYKLIYHDDDEEVGLWPSPLGPALH